MTTLSELAPRPSTLGGPPAPGLRLAGVTGQVFRERREPLIGGDRRLALEILKAYGRAEEFTSFLGRYGNSFRTMGEHLLPPAGEPPAEADAIILAYQTPDLYYSDVAGCYLTQRFAGSPVPFSVAEQGPGAAFTALRIADAMCKLGELRHGVLFAFDQNAAVWEADEQVQCLPDSAVLLSLGASGSVQVAELTDQESADPAVPVAAVLARHPQAQVLAGRALSARLGSLATDPRVVPAPDGHLFTSAWMPLARRWPLTGPVLVADFDAVTERLYSCLLVPEESP